MSEDFQQREKRQVARVDLRARMLTLDEKLRTVQLLDLSHAGCRLGGLDEQLDRGTAVALKLPGLSEFTFGKIAWSHDGMVGVEFIEPLFEPLYRYLKDKLFGLDNAA